MKLHLALLVPWLLTTLRAERINHEGRVLPDPPTVTTSLLFNTPEADAVLSGLQVFPKDNPWNEAIANRPVLSNSAAMISQITSDLASDRRTLRPFYEMNYVLVPDNQPTKPIEFLDFPDESDLDGGTNPIGLYPIPSNLPIEQWPLGTGNLTLQQWQAIANDDGSDRHSLILKPGAGYLWETWRTNLAASGWQAANGAKFNLNSNALRPAGWTSGDAAGLSLFAGLVRYDECARGMVEHAIRLVVRHSRKAYIYPATHYASTLTGTNYPAMGQRLRLKASFTIPNTLTVYEKAIAFALQKYGAIVADNGNFFSISVAPDTRFPSNAFNNLSSIGIGSFEVIQTTGPTEGPRSPGAPSADAGTDQFMNWPAPVTLHGVVSDPDTAPANLTVRWRRYDGPGTVTFGNANMAQTTASFSVPGRYTLMLSVDDGVHTTAYDAVVVDTTIRPELIRVGPDIRVRFPTVSGRLYRVERSSSPAPASWSILADNVSGTGGLVEVPHSNAIAQGRQFYRVSVLP